MNLQSIARSGIALTKSDLQQFSLLSRITFTGEMTPNVIITPPQSSDSYYNPWDHLQHHLHRDDQSHYHHDLTKIIILTKIINLTIIMIS